MKSALIKIIIFFLVLCACLLGAEALFRHLDHQPMNKPLSYLSNLSDPDVVAKTKWISLKISGESNSAVDTSLYSNDPQVPPVKQGRFNDEIGDIRKNARLNDSTDNELRVWNSRYINKVYCDNDEGLFTLESSQGFGVVYAFESYDGSPHPAFRFFPGCVSPTYGKFHVNEFGWGGDVVTLKKPDNTIRLAFLGASTTQQMSDCHFAYPDYVGNWLNKWAQDNRLNVRFEIINTGRAGLRSPDFAAIMKYELMPVEPDIVVYYEGRNQFVLDDLVCNCKKNSAPYWLLQNSAVFRRVAKGLNINIFGAIENAKPENIIKFPRHVKIKNPDIDSPLLPLDLPQILRDLDTIRILTEKLGSDLIVCSYAMLLSDVILTEGLKYGGVYSYWAEHYGMVRLAEIQTMNEFENLALKKYCEKKQLKFIDVAKELPRLPEGFRDGIHLNCEGVKYHAWLVLLELLPYIHEKIKTGELPQPSRFSFSRHPYISDNFQRVQLPVSCN